MPASSHRRDGGGPAGAGPVAVGGGAVVGTAQLLEDWVRARGTSGSSVPRSGPARRGELRQVQYGCHP
ncbi:hypothetical protein GCM10010211_62770 [Streptomyces albospinus]|uniref:Uncharacterized protein n=1 Tax=Streptomyces albospinus TaxID=285515 RepID=A0ABQ2VLI4_9ACTN|nr:hypothetical protein GCM10010211_62770 [Streptomyces albospinus]